MKDQTWKSWGCFIAGILICLFVVGVYIDANTQSKLVRPYCEEKGYEKVSNYWPGRFHCIDKDGTGDKIKIIGVRTIKEVVQND